MVMTHHLILIYQQVVEQVVVMEQILNLVVQVVVEQAHL